MMEYDRARLKQTVRQAMKLQRPHPMLITLLFTIIVSVGSQIINGILSTVSGSGTLSSLYAQAVIDYEDPVYAIQYVLLSFDPMRLVFALFVGGLIAGIVTSLWSGLMRTGYAGFCLNMARGRQPQTDALFSVFPRCAEILLTQFLTGLFRGLWALLLGLGLGVVIFIAALLFAQLEVLFVLVLLIAYLAFFLGLIWITLRYAMVDFLLADQDLTGLDAIRESKRLMRGNTGRLFMLELSFIGWYLLEAAVISVIAVISAFVFVYGAAVPESLSDAMLMMAGAALGFLALIAVAGIAVAIFNLWLTPYITGAEALFYDWARGAGIAPGRGYGVGPTGGWGRPQSPNQPRHFDYNWAPGGPSAGTGIGPGPRDGRDGTPPQPPKSPKDDPWD